MKTYALKELLHLQAEYLETLDAEHCRGLATGQLLAFLGWLNIRNQTP